MSQKIKNADGTETEVFTPEEVKTQSDAAVAKAKNDAEASAAAMKTQLDAKEAELAKLKEKDMNFGKVKTEAEKDREEKDRLQKEINDLKTTVVGNFKTEMLKQLSNGDVELQKKIELEYSQFSGEAITNEQISERLQKSAKLAGVEKSASVLGSAFNRIGGRSPENAGSEPIKVAEASRVVGAKMGITEEDWKKYGDKVK